MAGKLVFQYRTCADQPSAAEIREVDQLVKSWLEDANLRPLGEAFRKVIGDQKRRVEADVRDLATLEGIGAVLEAAQGLGWPAALEILQAAAQDAGDGGAQDGEALEAQRSGGGAQAMPDAWGSDVEALRRDAADDYQRRWDRENRALIGKGVRTLAAQRSGGRVMPMPSDD